MHSSRKSYKFPLAGGPEDDECTHIQILFDGSILVHGKLGDGAIFNGTTLNNGVGGLGGLFCEDSIRFA